MTSRINQHWAAWQAGEAKAFPLLYKEMLRIGRQHAKQILGWEDETVAETAADTAVDWATADIKSFSAWFHRVAKNAALDCKRQRARRVSMKDADQAVASTLDGELIVKELLEQMTPAKRRAVQRRLEGGRRRAHRTLYRAQRQLKKILS